ncbi:polysaccharide deacetylase family protein [Mesorhizobium marinum]|uniref:polysaccharide deacetylase family protein n=1 Tax=Mesorhizobium marinum TaxID=3228790 RepID=UPI003465F24D
MTAPLAATRVELARWRDAGLTLPVWWRDDDAVAPTPALERLLGLAGRLQAPLHLAVIPATATHELADRLSDASGVFVLVHGWQHANHAPPDQKKAEFGPHRDTETMCAEIASGRSLLKEIFADQMLPVFTPPWNRLSQDVADRLGALGFLALSTFTPRTAKYAAPGLVQVNTHLDPVAWKSGGGLLDPGLLDAQIARQLEARRSGDADNAEPYGLLTHHLVQDDPTWSFTESIVETLLGSGAARWTPPLHECARSRPYA